MLLNYTNHPHTNRYLNPYAPHSRSLLISRKFKNIRRMSTMTLNYGAVYLECETTSNYSNVQRWSEIEMKLYSRVDDSKWRKTTVYR